MQWLPRSEVLTFEEIERLARIFVERYGVDGHPPDRRRADRAGPPAGAGRQARRAAHRRRAGRPGDDHQRGHVATASPTHLRDGRAAAGSTSASTRSTGRSSSEMTRRDELANVLDGIEAAKEAGFDPVKINAVIERGVNDDEIVDLATFGREHGVEVRFIEFMPLDADGHWVNDQVVGQDEIVAAINAVYPLEQMPARGAAPADRWRYLDGARHGRRDPDGHQAVLRRLRPRAPHRRRPVPHLPVRQRRVRPARRAACAAAPTTMSPRRSRRAVGTKWAGHQINQVNFIRPGKLDEPDRRLTRRLQGGHSSRDSCWNLVASAASPTMSTGRALRRHSQSSRSLARPRIAASPFVCSRVKSMPSASSFDTNHSPHRVGAVRGGPCPRATPAAPTSELAPSVLAKYVRNSSMPSDARRARRGRPADRRRGRHPSGAPPFPGPCGGGPIRCRGWRPSRSTPRARVRPSIERGCRCAVWAAVTHSSSSCAIGTFGARAIARTAVDIGDALLDDAGPEVPHLADVPGEVAERPSRGRRRPGVVDRVALDDVEEPDSVVADQLQRVVGEWHRRNVPATSVANPHE